MYENNVVGLQASHTIHVERIIKNTFDVSDPDILPDTTMTFDQYQRAGGLLVHPMVAELPDGVRPPLPDGVIDLALFRRA